MKDEYYANTAARLDTIIGGDTDHFLRLQRVKNEWQELGLNSLGLVGHVAVPPFNVYVEEQYGIRIAMEGNSLSLDYSVVNDAKYTVFLLKFSR